MALVCNDPARFTVFWMPLETLMPPFMLFLVLLCMSCMAGAGPPVLHLQGSRLLALDPESGEVRWSLQARTRLFEPVVADRRVYVTGIDGLLRTLDLANGEPGWSFRTGDEWLYPPVVTGGRVVLVGRHSGLYALNPRDGSRLWHIALTGEPVYSPLAIDEQWVVQAQFDGSLLAIDVSDGQVKWHIRLATAALEMGTDGRTLLLGGYAPLLRAISADDGRLLWSTELPGRVALPPLTQGDRAWVVTDNPALALLDLGSGRILDQRGLAYLPTGIEPDGLGGIRIIAQGRKKTGIQRVTVGNSS